MKNHGFYYLRKHETPVQNISKLLVRGLLPFRVHFGIQHATNQLIWIFLRNVVT